jgi:hypothetical protein
MGANSLQGLALLVFLVAFTFLGMALWQDGSLLMYLLFVVGLAGSVAMFLKAKPLEYSTK